jgi:hypothetical protein
MIYYDQYQNQYLTSSSTTYRNYVGGYTGAGTQMPITWVVQPEQVEPEPDDPIAWLKGRVQETIDEVDWPVAA